MTLLFGLPLALQSLILLTIDLGTELAPAIALSKEDMVSNSSVRCCFHCALSDCACLTGRRVMSWSAHRATW